MPTWPVTILLRTNIVLLFLCLAIPHFMFISCHTFYCMKPPSLKLCHKSLV